MIGEGDDDVDDDDEGDDEQPEGTSDPDDADTSHRRRHPRQPLPTWLHQAFKELNARSKTNVGGHHSTQNARSGPILHLHTSSSNVTRFFVWDPLALYLSTFLDHGASLT